MSHGKITHAGPQPRNSSGSIRLATPAGCAPLAKPRRPRVRAQVFDCVVTYMDGRDGYTIPGSDARQAARQARAASTDVARDVAAQRVAHEDVRYVTPAEGLGLSAYTTD